MPFYELFCITGHYADYSQIRRLVMVSARLVMDRGGVVRSIRAEGPVYLPQRMRRHKAYHEMGDYWTMYFDASPRTLKALSDSLGQDPRVIRHTVLKLGERLQDIEGLRERTVLEMGAKMD